MGWGRAARIRCLAGISQGHSQRSLAPKYSVTYSSWKDKNHAYITLGQAVSARYRRVDAELHGNPPVHAEEEDSLSGDEKKTRDYYDVEGYVRESSKKPKPRPLPVRVINRILSVFDPTQGFWIILLGLPMTFGLAVGMLVLGLKYGAAGFYGALAVILSIGTYALDKKFGKHLQVEDFPLIRRMLTIIPAFLALAGIFVLMFYLAGKF